LELERLLRSILEAQEQMEITLRSFGLTAEALTLIELSGAIRLLLAKEEGR
jgi:hypothetical protein